MCWVGVGVGVDVGGVCMMVELNVRKKSQVEVVG